MTTPSRLERSSEERNFRKATGFVFRSSLIRIWLRPRYLFGRFWAFSVDPDVFFSNTLFQLGNNTHVYGAVRGACDASHIYDLQDAFLLYLPPLLPL